MATKKKPMMDKETPADKRMKGDMREDKMMKKPMRKGK